MCCSKAGEVAVSLLAGAEPQPLAGCEGLSCWHEERPGYPWPYPWSSVVLCARGGGFLVCLLLPFLLGTRTGFLHFQLNLLLKRTEKL